MLILLPPSEGKASPRRGKALDLDRLSFPSLTEPREVVLDALVGLCTTENRARLEQAAAVLRVGKTQGDEVARNADLRAAPTTRADRVYTGVLYEALDLPSLTGPAKRRATSWVAVTSGLFGLLRPADAIPAYRLSGDVALPQVGNVATYWKRHLDAAVREAAGKGLVVDLRSSTYAAFWRPEPDLARKVVTVRVLHETGDTRKAVSHFNKATKGRLVRALLEDGGNPTSPASFADHLTALGWKVERAGESRTGTRLDVIVTDL